MIKLIQIEVFKMFHQKKSWISFLVFALIMALIHGGLYLEGQGFMDLLLQNYKNQLQISGHIINGYFVSFIALNTLWVHIPILLVIITADLVSGEMNTGTIRLIMTSPISRTRFILAKTMAAFIYVISFMIFMLLITLLPSLIIFGKGDLLVFMNGIQVILEEEVLYRFLLSFAFGILSMSCFVAISILFSVWLRNTIAAILSSLGLLVISTLIQSFGFDFLSSLQNFLFTYHMTQWQLFFVRDIPIQSILESVVFLLMTTVFAILIAIIRFNKTNITE